jgi:integrase
MRRGIRGGVRLKHLNASGQYPSGNVRFYYRPKGAKGIALPDFPPENHKFLAAYAEAVNGVVLQTNTHSTGTIGAAIRAYLASDKYLSLAVSSRGVWRRQADDICFRYGKAKLVDLLPKHIRQDLARLDPHPANNRLRVWRSLCRWWVDAGLVDTDPARDVRKRETPASDGHKPWQRTDFAAFRLRWPIGTQERLAFELMYQSCAAIGDACRLGPANVQGEWLAYARKKTGTQSMSPLFDGPDWFEACDHYHTCVNAAPRHMTYLTTKAGASRSAKAVASWFSRAATSAGLPDLSAHGIRKGRAAIFRENGASQDQRMAILGHETEAEARRYSKSADLARVISGTEKFQLPSKVGTEGIKSK